MAIYRLDIPLENYDGDDTYEQRVYFGVHHTPSKEQVLEQLKFLHERDSKYPEYIGTWERAIKLIESIKDFPRLEAGVVSTNTFVDTKFGKRPLTMSVPEILFIP